jgi:tol-pal system protein YbgF
MRVRALLAVTALALATGCVSSSDVERLQAQVFDLQDQVAQLKRSSSTEVQQVNQKMARQTEELLKSYADLTARVGEGDEKLQSTVGQIEQTNYRLDRLAQQLTQIQSELVAMKTSRGTTMQSPVSETAPPAGGTPAGGTVIVEGETSDDPIEVYQSAYRDYQRGNYDLARQGFDDFAKSNPQSDLADNAMYWIGECHFSQGSHKSAIDAFDAMLEAYPQSDKAAAANLKKALAFVQQNQIGQGVEQLRYVTSTYPGTDEARIAADRLHSLGNP